MVIVVIVLIVAVFIGVITTIERNFDKKYRKAIQRNLDVYDERRRVLELIGIAARDDISNGRPWEWRNEAFDRISYGKMFNSERDVESFFAGHPATIPGPRNVINVNSRVVTSKELTQGL